MGNTKRKGTGPYNQKKTTGRGFRGKRGPATESETPIAVNDIAWYSNNAQILKDVASFPFPNAVGSRISNLIPASYDAGTFTQNAIPGIMAMHYVPTFGYSSDGLSAINIASDRVYSHVRFANSGSSNYVAPDYMIYQLAMGQAYSVYFYFARTLTLLHWYSQTNKYMPKAIVEAAGFDFEDLLGQEPRVRALLNLFAERLSAFAVPRVFPYNTRQMWLTSNVFKDSDTTKAQLYIFRPTVYYTFSGYTDHRGGELIAHDYPNKITIQNMESIIEDILSPIVRDEDIGIMSGDTKKAFGQEQLVTLPFITETMRSEPVISEQVNWQIENLTCFGRLYDVDEITNEQVRCGLTQHDGILYYTPASISYYGSGATSHLLNFHTNDVTPEMVMEGTRFTNVADDVELTTDAGGTPVAVCTYSDLSDAYVEQVSIYTLLYGDTGVTMEENVIESAFPASTAAAAVRTLGKAQAFSRRPTQVLLDVWDIAARSAVGIMCEMNNVTSISCEELGRIHTHAIMSEFNVPGVTSDYTF